MLAVFAAMVPAVQVATTGPAAAELPVDSNITPVHSSKCLDIVGGPTAISTNGADINQWKCHGFEQDNQHWKLVFSQAVDGHIYSNIKNYWTDYCLDVRGGPGATQSEARVQLYQCLGYNQHNQQWRLKPHPEFPHMWQIIARHSNKCLDVIGGALSDGARLQQYECGGADHMNQWFRIFGPGGVPT